MRRSGTWLAAAIATALGGCVQTQWQQGAYYQPAQPRPTQTLKTADQTMDLELTDRVSRLDRLAHMQGVVPPQIETATLSPAQVPGANRPIPVIRVSFDERDFFDPGSAVPRAAGGRVLGVISENLRRDVPDIRLTVLGHTDASGNEQNNTTLSRDRATEVVRMLVASGANPGQLDAVAIGDAQPIAPNNSAAGRSRNRRVEFLISPSEPANLAVVSMRPVNPAFLAVESPGAGKAPPPSRIRRVAVLRPTYSGPADVSETAPAQNARRVTLAAAGPDLSVGGEEASGSPVMSPVRPAPAGRPAAGNGDSGSPVTANYNE